MTTYARPLVNGTPTTGQVVKAAHVNEPIDQIYDTILAGGITSDQIAAGAVDTSELATEAVTAVKMDGTLPDGSTLAAATLTADPDRTVVDLAYAKTGDTVQHDSQGGYSNCDVDSIKTKVYTKYFTGTLDSDSETLVAHGVTRDNILSMNAVIFNTADAEFTVKDYYNQAVADTIRWVMRYGTTNIRFRLVGTAAQGQKYRIKMDYIL